MRSFMIGAALLFSQSGLADYQTGALPQSLDEVLEITSKTNGVADCEEQFSETGSYCLMRSTGGKDVFIEAYLVLDKEEEDGRFSTKEKILDQYIRVADWPAYAEASEKEYILEFDLSEIIKDITKEDGNRELVHAFKYASKAPFPLNTLKVNGTATYTVYQTPMTGAVLSTDFKVSQEWGSGWKLQTPLPDGSTRARGIKGQDANIHVVDLADEDKFLLVYRTRIRPDITLLISLAAKYVASSVEDILTGMYVAPPAQD